jgi:hypothetical protein
MKLQIFNPEDIITTDKLNVVYIGGQRVSQEEMKILIEEVKWLEKSKIWRIFTETVRWEAQQTMFEKSKDWNDMLTGKTMLYNLSLLERICKLIKSKIR